MSSLPPSGRASLDEALHFPAAATVASAGKATVTELGVGQVLFTSCARAKEEVRETRNRICSRDLTREW